MANEKKNNNKIAEIIEYSNLEIDAITFYLETKNVAQLDRNSLK